MSKFKFNILFLCIGFSNAFSQAPQVAENGKVQFANIVELDSMKKGVLFQNGIKWLKAIPEEEIGIVKKDSASGSLTASSSFFVYAQSSVLKKISGKISYSIALDVKDSKYRYRLTDFVFHYYKVDRTYQSVDTGKTKMLEEADAPGWQRLWRSHKTYVKAKIQGNIELLNTAMKERPVNPGKTLKTVEW